MAGETPAPAPITPEQKVASFDLLEGLADVPLVIKLITDSVAAAKSLPEKPKFVEIAKAYGVVEGTPLMGLAELIDTVLAQAKD